MKPYKSIEHLASQILYHKRLYYKGKSILENEEYDILEAKLRELSPHHPVLSFVGYEVHQKKEKVHHQTPMLSLLKTYEPSELLQFLKKYECVAIDKFDGMALSLEYNDKGHLARASTRGNGQFGEDVTEQVYHIIEIPKTLKLPSELKNHRIEIRGEIYFPISEFEKYSDLFDSFRNAVPGTLGRKDINEAADILKTFLFCPFDILVYEEANIEANTNADVNSPKLLSSKDFANLVNIPCRYSEKFKFIQTLGFYLHENFIFKLDQSELTENDLILILDNLFSKARDHQIDGLVFRIEDEIVWESLGNTAHHPRGTFAFKRAGETAITEIIDIEQNVGRSGKVSFRAKLSPVFLSNAKISYATLHNAEYIEKGNYAVGARVKIIRSGEVIPAILERVDNVQNTYKLPTACVCGSDLVRKGPELFCSLFGGCEYSDQESLVHFVAKIEMLGVSEKIVHRLRAAGLLNEPADLYKISVEDLLQIEGFGIKSAQNTVESIQSRKEVHLWQFLTALGLKGGGEVKCKEIAQKFTTLEAIFALTEEDLSSEKGWAEKSAHDFVSSLHFKKHIIEHLLNFIILINDASASTIDTSHVLYGKNICITGTLSKPRSEIKKTLEKLGAKIVSSVNNKTDYLLCNDVSRSSKYKEAKNLNIPIITEKELSKLY